MRTHDTEPILADPQTKRRPSRRAQAVGVVLAGLAVFAGCGGESSKIEGKPTKDVCHELETHDDLGDQMCDAFDKVFRAAVDRYQSDDRIEDKSERPDSLTPGKYVFSYLDKRSEHRVEVVVGMKDEAPNLDDPYTIAVFPEAENGRSVTQLEQGWSFARRDEDMSFYARQHGKEYAWTSQDIITSPVIALDLWGAATDLEEIMAKP